MTRGLTQLLKRWRDNYYCSLLLAAIAKPLHSVCKQISTQTEKRVRKNGVSIRLPNGTIMRIAPNAGVGLASTLFWHGLDGYEVETSRTLRFFFERASTFVDVGANYGVYSVLAGLWNPQLRVVAFEPLPPIFEGLKTNIAINRLEERVVCENIALSSQSGFSAFSVPTSDNSDCQATGTLSRISWQVRQGWPEIQVKTVRFDDYESSHSMTVDLVKIDVEDFEAEVLSGMRRVIERDRPFIVCEILPRNREHRNERTRAIVESLGYTPYWITSSGYIRVSRFDFDRVRCEFLLSPVSLPGDVVTNIADFYALCGARTG